MKLRLLLPGLGLQKEKSTATRLCGQLFEAGSQMGSPGSSAGFLVILRAGVAAQRSPRPMNRVARCPQVG
jgi:hypothetical protein